MIESKVTCDHCNADLTSTGNCTGYRVLLTSEGIPSRGPAVTAMLMYPPIERSMHFCGLRCLREWVTAIKG